MKLPPPTTAQDKSNFISGVWKSRVSQLEQKTPNDNEEILLDPSILSRPKVSHVIIEVLRELWDTVAKPAVGDETTPDEMIHLAAGLQFTGVKSVVGTLWTISDTIAYMLVPEFYKEFCASGSSCLAQRCFGAGKEKGSWKNESCLSMGYVSESCDSSVSRWAASIIVVIARMARKCSKKRDT
ncbi:hypothetical protein JVT61DRAFT_14747 [Boletus reticuloceps]|uniref:CHAT domain-containing protein n=1 Tax=Boletus reticuloceps TaxID=495285 RepID=A0A8I2YW11_9AGAM|nr:hypothetical protein JVT61DRAFT_14747 [Boletus reticuloceps]